MNTRLMTRIFSAMENKEDQILDQFEDDINVALEDGTCEAEGQYSIEKIDDSTAKIHDVVNDEDTIASVVPESGEIHLSNPLGKRYEELMTACETKSFASTMKNGKLVVRIGENDVIFDLKKSIAYNADDERQHWPFNGSDPFSKVLEKIEKELGASATKSKGRTFTAKHTEDHLNNQMLNNIANLSPEVQAYVRDKYKARYNKTRNFAAADKTDVCCVCRRGSAHHTWSCEIVTGRSKEDIEKSFKPSPQYDKIKVVELN